jgi:hypothetical protein
MLERGHVPGSFTTGRDGSWDYPDGDERTGPFHGGRRHGLRVLISCLALLALVSGVLVIADRTSGDDSASCGVPEVAASSGDDAAGGSPTVDDRPMVPPPPQPLWLGLPGTEPFDRSTYPPSFGWTFGEIFGSSLRFVESDHDLGWPIAVSVRRGELQAVPGTWTSAEVQGHPGVAGAVSGGSAAVLFELGDGWMASVAATGDDPKYGTDGFDGALAEVRATADGLVPLGAEHWVPIVDTVMQDLGDPAEACYRLGLNPEDGGTFVTSIEPPQVDTTLTIAGAPTNAFQLVSTPAPRTVPGGVQVDVRDRNGYHLVVQDVAEPTQVLVWNEGDGQHRLHFPAGIPVDDAVSIANRLEVLDDQAWSDAIFPTSVPADLEAADWSRDARLVDGAG